MEKEQENKPTSSFSNFGFRHNFVALNYMVERNEIFPTGVAALEFFVCFAIASNLPYEPDIKKPWTGKGLKGSNESEKGYQMAISTLSNRADWLPPLVGYYCGGSEINRKIEYLANAGLHRFMEMVKNKFQDTIDIENLITHHTILEIMEEILKENPIEDTSHQTV